MKVVTREIVDKVTFSEDEMRAFKNLRDVIFKCCDGYADSYSCKECPFDEYCCGREMGDFLNYIINYCEDEDEN